MKEYESDNRSKKTAELKKQAQKLTRRKVPIYPANIAKTLYHTMQVSFKFRDPLSAIGINELLLPLRRVITEHEDVSAYVQRAGGLNKAILAVLSEKNFLRYSEGHVGIHCC